MAEESAAESPRAELLDQSGRPIEPIKGAEGREGGLEVPVEPVGDFRHRTEVGVGAILDPASISTRPEEEKAILQDRLREQLRAAMNAEARVRVFAKWTDRYGLDAMLGMIPGDISDALCAVGYVAYLTMEARNAGLKKNGIAKIIGWQTLDALIGIIPFIDPVMDYFISKANVRSLEVFRAHTEKLIAEAKEQGIDDEAIAELRRASTEMERKLGLVGSVAGAWTEKKQLPPPDLTS